jgi:saccharopine dehydrogenase-like NADP-dependent oxidoreductase
MANITLFGSGLVGAVIARDLASHHSVTVIDKNKNSLQKFSSKKNISIVEADATDKKVIERYCEKADVVVTALPGFIGFQVLKQIVELGKNVADISFYPENALELNELAQEKNCTVIVDCGVAPGMSNFFAGYYAHKMAVDEFICYVGGLPFERKFPFEYKAPFSPVDVIEEYTRPARLKENSKIVVKPALSEIEYLNFDKVGTLEAFNTDGLRSLLYTLNIPNMKEKTLRYPGHTRLIQAFIETGFFENKEIEINGHKLKPIELTTQLLKDAWKLNEGDDEFTIMRIIIKGKENGKSQTYIYDLFDKYDKNTGFTSMSRTTGFTCTAMVNMILDKVFTQKGVFPPELLPTNDKIFNYVINYLEKRNVVYKPSVISE